MKCDELKDYDIMDIEAMDDERLEKSESGKIQVTRVCIKSEVDAAIAELKAEINRKEAVGKRWFEQCMEARAENVRLKHALWLARGYIMTLLQRDFQRLAYQCNNDDYKKNLLHRRNRYYELSEKCRAKAEEYK